MNDLSPRPLDSFARGRRKAIGSIALALSLAWVPAAFGGLTATEPAPSGVELTYQKEGGTAFSKVELETTERVLRGRLGDSLQLVPETGSTGAVTRVRLVLPDRELEDFARDVRPLVESRGRLSFEPVLNEARPGLDPRAELERLKTWWRAQETPDLDAFNALPHGEGGPASMVRWRSPGSSRFGVAIDGSDEMLDAPRIEVSSDLEDPEHMLPCLNVERLHPARGWEFGSADLARVSATIDELGFPAVGFDLQEGRAETFGDFTEAYVDRQLAIVLDGSVLSAPFVNQRLPGAALIQGRFSDVEVGRIVALLRSGELPAQLELVELQPSSGR